MIKVNQCDHSWKKQQQKTTTKKKKKKKKQGLGIQPLGTSSGSILKLLLFPSFCTSSRKISFASLFYMIFYFIHDVKTLWSNIHKLLLDLRVKLTVVVPGLLPRKGYDIKAFNSKIKQLCQEYDVEFVGHNDSFVMPSGEVPRSLFYGDKISLRLAGTATLVCNLDLKCRSHPVNVENARHIRCMFDLMHLEHMKQSFYAWKTSTAH